MRNTMTAVTDIPPADLRPLVKMAGEAEGFSFPAQSPYGGLMFLPETVFTNPKVPCAAAMRLRVIMPGIRVRGP